MHALCFPCSSAFCLRTSQTIEPSLTPAPSSLDNSPKAFLSLLLPSIFSASSHLWKPVIASLLPNLILFPEWSFKNEIWLCFSPALMPSAAAAKSLQSCLTLCDPIDSSPPGSPVPEILQARTPEWVAISFSNVWKWSRSVVSDPQWPHGLQRSRLLHPWDFPGKSTGVGCHCLLQILYRISIKVTLFNQQIENDYER